MAQEQPTDTAITRAVQGTLEDHKKALVATVETVHAAAIPKDTLVPPQLMQPTEATPPPPAQPMPKLPAAPPPALYYTDSEMITARFLEQATAAFFARYSYMPDMVVISHVRRITLPEVSWFQLASDPEPILIRSPGDQEILPIVPVTADIPWDSCLVLRLGAVPVLHHSPIL